MGVQNLAEVRHFLRPRDLGLFRTRAPIRFQLDRAAREGRLIWHGPQSFAMLSAPGDRTPGRGGRARRWIDHQWPLVMLGFSFVVFVVLAFVVAALHPLLGPAATRLALTLVELVFLLVILADQVVRLLAMAGRGLRSLLRGKPSAAEVAAERLPFEEWTMRLCHHVGERGADELLAAVSDRLVALAGPDAALACPRDGITTAAMRARVADWADGLGADHDQEISVRIPRQLPARRHRFAETGSFFFLWLAVIVVLLLASASLVADMERDACAGACAGRPATYPAALEWLAYRLLWQEPPGLSAASPFARGAGLVAEFLLLFTGVVAVAGGVRYARYRKQLADEHEQTMSEVYRRERVLLLVATAVEQEAVLRLAPNYREFGDGHPVHRLGVVGGVDVVLAHVGQGMTGPASAPYAVPELLDEWRPRYVIMLGICFGLREERQRLGDVIVAEQLEAIRLRAGETDLRDRGDRVTAGHRLVERFRVAQPPPAFRVWPGLLLSWDVLVDSGPIREALKRRYPDAEGGEMEGAAVYASSVRAGTQWIVVKGICDWGRDKNADSQARAAANAATLVLDLITARAFA